MIDRDARNRLAELIRGLVSGLITNDQFEEAIPRSGDAAIGEVYIKGAWFLFDDFREHKLSGKYSLSKDDKSVTARWVLFLKTDIEYEWPSPSFKERFLHFVSLGMLGKSTRKLWTVTGNVAYWPFLNEAQLVEARQGTGYLGNKNT